MKLAIVFTLLLTGCYVQVSGGPTELTCDETPDAKYEIRGDSPTCTPVSINAHTFLRSGAMWNGDVEGSVVNEACRSTYVFESEVTQTLTVDWSLGREQGVGTWVTTRDGSDVVCTWEVELWR